MLNDHTLQRFEALAPGLLKPIYADYSFANIPATVHYLLTGERLGALLPADCFGGRYPKPQRIVLIFVDSFGWQFWQRHWQQSRVMRCVVEQGVLTPISALFPSTTSASVSTLNLGVLPAKHALYEWVTYIPAYGEVIQSLAFASHNTEAKPGSLVARGFDPKALLCEHETAHQRLAAHGVKSIQLAHAAYANSPYNSIASAGAEVIGHRSLPEALSQLKYLLRHERSKGFINLYWAGLDTAAHMHGPGARKHEDAVGAFWQLLDNELAGLQAEGTLFLFTSDHGHVASEIAETIYLNERWPQLRSWLSASPTGQPIWPNGCPRDVFLHLVPERRRQALELLTNELAGVAHVMTTTAAIDEGLFGPGPVVDELRRRIGDILILPRLGHSVWWNEPGITYNRFRGHHGGLTPEEVITVLGVATSLG